MMNAVEQLKQALLQADAVLVGAGAGLSASAGLAYSGARFQTNFADFIETYGFTDMYTAGFYPFAEPEELWGYWSRHIFINRYQAIPEPVYEHLLALIADKDYFVLTTNVDHCFQRTGFDKQRLLYTQGDYGLWQCSVPCSHTTYDNEETVRRMVSEQHNRRIPSELIPYCPRCGAPLSMNLRADDTFVEDAGWHKAAARYQDFIRRHQHLRLLFLELGVGANTPGIIKYPFWQMTQVNPQASYITINNTQAYAPAAIRKQSLCIQADIGQIFSACLS